MVASGSLGINPFKNYGSAPAIQTVIPGRIFSDTYGYWAIVTAPASITQYQFVSFTLQSSTNTAATAACLALTTTTAGSNTLQVGVYQAATTTAAGDLIPVWIGGPQGGGYGRGIKGNVLISYVAGANLNTTATAGAADDASTTVIKGCAGLATEPGSGTLAVELISTTFLYVN